jgi:DNA ligase-1
MLAHVYEPNKNKKNQIVFPCCVQPKLDGLRCIVYLAGDNAKPIYQSRTGAHFSTMSHLDVGVADFIRKIRDKLGGDQAIYLDGELYTNKIPFETLAGLIKKKKITEEDRENLAIVEYNIYDVYIPSLAELDFITRWELLKTLYDGTGDQVAEFTLTSSENPPPYKGIRLVTTEMAGLNDFRRKFCEYVEQGYEGVMLRNLSGVYRTNYRSHDLQKYKEFFEDEFEIVGFSEGEGRERGTVIWKCITKEGREFSVRPKGTVEYRKELFNDAKKYVGKMATIIYQELSEYGVPRFPVGKAVRDGY